MWYEKQVSSCSVRIVLVFLGLHFSKLFLPSIPPVPSLTESCLFYRYKVREEAENIQAGDLNSSAPCNAQGTEREL